MRVSPPKVFPEATRSSRPPGDAAGSPDAHRQMGFLLGGELDLVLQGLEAEGAVASASSAAKYRTQPLAAVLGPWSRAWLARLQALHAAEWGNYASAIPLVRVAADLQAAVRYLFEQDADEWRAWIDQGGIAPAHDAHAAEFRLQGFRAAEVLAVDDLLGPLYRVTMDLSMPQFAISALLTANESNADRVMTTFGDRDFHLGLAELVLGWLLTLSVAQARLLLAHEGTVALPDPERLRTLDADAIAALGRPDRCRVERVEHRGASRYLVHNWRRTSGAAAKRILL